MTWSRRTGSSAGRGAPRPFACEALEARRLLAAGDLDRSFDDDGLADEVNLDDGLTFHADDLALQPDGKTVIVGSTSAGRDQEREGDAVVVARLLVDGRLDTSFGSEGTGVVRTPIEGDAHGHAVVVQPDGKIVVVGTAKETFRDVNEYRQVIVRYEPWGALDPTWDHDGVRQIGLGDYTAAFDVALQDDGKLVVVGEFKDGFDLEFFVQRFNPDGSTDFLRESDFDIPNAPAVAFDFNGNAATNPYHGSILVAGTNQVEAAAEPMSALALRLRRDGSFVNEFDGDGQVSFRYPGADVTRATAVIAQPGGKVVLAGYAGGGQLGDNGFLLVRFNPDGTLDPTFGGQGTGYVLTNIGGGRDDRASSVIPSYNGDRLIVAGSSDGNFALARYTLDGALDTTFQSGGTVVTPWASGPLPRLAPGPGRRFTAAGGPHFHAVRYLDEGANLVAIGTFDVNGGSEAGSENANFLVTRTERLPTPQRVFLNVGGTAAAPFFISGEDYNASGFSISAFEGGSFVDIPANQTFVAVSIVPVDDTLVEGDETATFSIAPDAGYDIGTPAAITLELHDNDASTVYVSEDAHVREGAPSHQFGPAELLETRAIDLPLNIESFLKFDVSAIDPNASSVRLRVFGRLSSGATPVPTAVFGVSASGWSENGITWDNRPAPSTAALASVDVVGPTETRYTFDVTEFVRREKAAGRNVITFLMRNTAPSDGITLWASRSSEYSDPRLVVANTITSPGLAPRVAQVFVASSAWSAAFRQSLEDHGLGDRDLGYAVGDGAAQLRALPWANLDRVSVRFTTGVAVVAENLAVRGARGGDYAVADFAYDDVESVATWTLAGGLGAGGGDRVLLDLDGDSPGGVNNGARIPRFLDGDWADGADAYPSGDGAAGGDFRFRVNVLPADVSGDGRVTALDASRVRAHLFRRAGEPFSGAGRAYSPLYDLDGDAVVGTRDLAAARAAQFSRLPVELPVAVRRKGYSLWSDTSGR
jgi:uncharacterized delta-60 repeat protein